MVAVFAAQVRQGTLDMAARGGGLAARRRGMRKEGRRKETTDKKSNNPHLTGEKTQIIKIRKNNQRARKKHIACKIMFSYFCWVCGPRGNSRKFFLIDFPILMNFNGKINCQIFQF